MFDDYYNPPRRGGEDTVDGPAASGGPSPGGSGPRVNRAGLAVRRNSSAVALKELSLSEEVPPKKCSVAAEPLFGARLTWGQGSASIHFFHTDHCCQGRACRTDEG